jgi:putative ABC transport system permease protein
MLKNYLKIALRNLHRYAGPAVINILGLTIGITGCLLIGLFVWDELQYDEFLKNGHRVSRIYLERTSNTGTSSAAVTPPVFASYMQQHYPEVQQTLRILMWSGKKLVEVNEKKAYEEKGMIADSTFFRVFPLPFLKGDPRTALQDKSAIVITESIAKKYFGHVDPIDKTILLDKAVFTVKGVLARIPEHFHLDLNYIVPLSAAGLPAERMQSWVWQQFFTYVVVKEGTNIQQLQKKFQENVKKESEPQTVQSGFTYLPKFQPLKDIHLHSANFEFDNAKRGNITYVKGLTIIAIFVLLIACFNFINLSTAQSFRRAKEIGVRKVIGADRKQLVFQFTGETILVSFISVFIAVIAVALLLPSLNAFTGKSISFNLFANPLLLLLVIAATLLIGLISGFYPALVMSGFQPISVLKGLKTTGDSMHSSGTLRQALVILQFTLSALLIVSTVIVYKQINFLHDTDLGFNKDQLIYFNVQGAVAERPEVFKQELKRSPGVVSVTGGYGLPGDALAGDEIIVPGKDGRKQYSANQLIVDHDYIKTLDLQVVAGRDFSSQYATDVENAFIINETAVRELGFGTPEAALGKPLHWNKWIPDSLNPVKKGKIIGVVKDFHVKSMHEKLSVTVLQIYPPILLKMAVKVKSADLAATIRHINKTWNAFSPEFPLDYKFLDENFAAMYSSEEKLGSLLLIFTSMAIFIASIGLFGLAAFNVKQRIKEIGIRKVLGASVLNIIAMLSRNFLRPVFIASVIAFPIAWWAMHNWLQDFEYRITINWSIFLVCGASSLLIALLTVSSQAIKAATANPVKSLRTE